ncbi:unnamed protein product, partial [Prorocentrum cordatum]
MNGEEISGETPGPPCWHVSAGDREGLFTSRRSGGGEGMEEVNVECSPFSLFCRGEDIVRLQLALSGEVPAGTSQPLRDFAEDLVQFAVARGSRDDCTAVAALIDVRSPGKRGSGGVSFPGAGAGSASRSAPSVLPPMSSSGRAAHSK